MAEPTQNTWKRARGDNVFLDQEEDRARQQAYDEMLEERRRWRAAAHEASRENLPLAIGALAPVAAVMAPEAIATGAARIAGGAARMAPRVLQGAGVSGALSGLFDARQQALTGDDHYNPAQGAAAVARGLGSGAGSAIGRPFGIPAAAGGAYLGSLAAHGSQGEAMASAVSTGIGHMLVPNEQGDAFFAALGRQVYRGIVGRTVVEHGARPRNPNGG